MKYKENCGVDSSTLEKGYSNTGGIPEDLHSIFKTEIENDDMVMSMEMEVKTGGFLERNNKYDRY